MKFQFDPDQGFQKIAIQSIVGIFEWIQTQDGQTIQIQSGDQTFLPSFIDVIPNSLAIEHNQDLLLANIHRIQTENNLSLTDDTKNFSIEMETGTGKTYCYLRTIFELYQTHRLKKFIIVVPSIAIRTWVVKTLEQTKSHFAQLYPGVTYDYYDYNSSKIDKMKDFYTSNNIQIMVMTSHSFSWEDRVIHRTGREDVGELSLIRYMSACRPVMILDEPQSILWAKTKEMIKLFTPLFTLYYSATHKEKFSCMYQLSPSEAYNNGLVKKIQVVSLTSDVNQSMLDMNCLAIENDPNGKLYAKLEVIKKLANGSVKKTQIKCKKWDLLEAKTNNPMYIWYRVWDMRRWTSVTIEKWWAEITLTVGEQNTWDMHDMIKAQIKQTVDIHFAKKDEIMAKGIKPLTLVFIDKVPNFIGQDEYIQSYFCECLQTHIPVAWDEKTKPYAYYFANKKNKREGTIEYIDELGNSKESREIEKQMYELIMREKETLLSFDNPVEFIFSHSALKEWRDNPNVFTLCTLRNSVSETEKRQSVWRGLRLPVNQAWMRIYDKTLNRLSVIVNQSYEDFCTQYQNNLIQEWYSTYEAQRNSGHIENGLPETVTINSKRENSWLFLWFWNIINQKTYYSIELDEEQLIADCVQRINDEIKNYDITWSNTIQVVMAWVEMDATHLGWVEEDSRTLQGEKAVFTLSSLTKIVQNELKGYKVSCSRKTLAEIMKQMNNITLFSKNPLQFAMFIAKEIHHAITKQYQYKCTYHLSDETYDITSVTEPIKIFKAHASYPKELFCWEKSLFERIMVDSWIEEQFGKWFQDDATVEFFFKLNDEHFKIKTPVGQFTPDRWVVLKKNIELAKQHQEYEVYFMVENKWNVDEQQLKTVENIKITCAKKHFQTLKSAMKSWFLECDSFDTYQNFKEKVRNLEI